jgi:hypothetical protein
MTGLPPMLAPPVMSDAQALAALVGGWQLVLWTTFHSDGTSDHPFGTDAIGQIMYSADGHMSCHLMRTDRPLFGKPSVYQVSDEELGQSMRGYSGYFGRFSIDAAAGVITHHVDGAWYPDWIGSDQARRFAFSGDRLFLEAEIGTDLVRIEWRRVVTDDARRLAEGLR